MTSGKTATGDEDSGGDIAVLVLALDGLDDDAYFGAGCCAISASDAIEMELRTWPFVKDVGVDAASGTARISMRTNDADIEAILEVLDSMGYPATVRIPG